MGYCSTMDFRPTNDGGKNDDTAALSLKKSLGDSAPPSDHRYASLPRQQKRKEEKNGGS